MNRSAIADLSEIVSSIAIIVTLVFLTVELRQNTTTLKQQTQQAALDSKQAELALLVEYPELGVLLASPGPLASPREHAVVDAWMSSAMRGREFGWEQYRDGFLDEEGWAAETAVVIAMMDSSLRRLWWDRLGRQTFGPGFVSFVDSLLAEHPATDARRPVLSWSVPDTLAGAAP